MKADHKEFEIELSEAESTSVCSCCGLKARVVRGFVYGDDFGSIYLANLYVCHPDIYVCLALGIGDWSEEAEETARCSVTLGIEPAQESLGMQIIDPAESPWVESQRLIGRMLDRGEALSGQRSRDFFRVADYIVDHDPRINAYLKGYKER